MSIKQLIDEDHFLYDFADNTVLLAKPEDLNYEWCHDYTFEKLPDKTLDNNNDTFPDFDYGTFDFLELTKCIKGVVVFLEKKAGILQIAHSGILCDNASLNHYIVGLGLLNTRINPQVKMGYEHRFNLDSPEKNTFIDVAKREASIDFPYRLGRLKKSITHVGRPIESLGFTEVERKDLFSKITTTK